MTKRVCVIGSGASGLTAMKCCLEEGHQVVCFEKTDSCGGLWRYRDTNVDGLSSVMRSTIINTSKETSAFSDFPPPKHFPNFMHNRYLVQYFELYAKEHGLMQHIFFNHEVQQIIPTVDYDNTGRWLVTVRRTVRDSTEVQELVFDGVLICTGHHAYPNMPVYPGLDSFQGTVMHTHDLKTCHKMANKNVMVVGNGNSGVDAATEASFVAKQVYLATRRGFWLFYRVAKNGRPIEELTRARWVSLVPTFIWEKYMINLLEQRINHAEYRIKPKHGIFSQHPTLNDLLPNRILSGTVQIKGKISKFTKSGVFFEGEDKETELDVVVFATGYNFKYPFLDKKYAKVDNTDCNLYQYMFPPDLKHPTLAFIGMIQPIGPIFPIQEMQSRWYALVLSGKRKLPAADVMWKDIRAKIAFNVKRFQSGVRYNTEVIYTPYMDKLASKVGCLPSLLWLLLTDPKLFLACFFYPPMSYYYRLKGPHTWSGARDAILSYKERTYAPLRTRVADEKSQGSSKLGFWFGATISAVGVFILRGYVEDWLNLN